MSKQRQTTIQSPHSKRRRLLHLPLLLGLLLFVSVATTAAQGNPPAGDGDDGPEPPPRGVDREAPPREPVIVETKQRPDGTTDTVIEIPPEADAYIASERPFQNFGADALFLGYNDVDFDNFGAQRPLLRFDIEGNIPDGALVNEADLRLRLSFSSPANDTSMPTAVYRLASSWNEFGVTWSNQPARGGVRASLDVGSALTWYEWDITGLVAEWANGTQVNHGVELVGDEQEQQRERAFYSRETTSAFFPRLIVNYTDLGDTQPPEVTVNPLPDYSGRNFPVSWSGSDQGAAGIDHYDVQYRVDDGDWIDWLEDVTFTSAQFAQGENGRRFQFRARGVDNVGNIEPFGDPEAETIVDTQPPTAHVNPLPALTGNTSFPVSWSGDDNGGSGINYYDVQYRFNNGQWVLWQNQTLATNSTFTAMNDGLYEFEARAADNLGHIESFRNQREAAIIVDDQPPFVEPRVRLPIIFKQAGD